MSVACVRGSVQFWQDSQGSEPPLNTQQCLKRLVHHGHTSPFQRRNVMVQPLQSTYSQGVTRPVSSIRLTARQNGAGTRLLAARNHRQLL